MKKPCSYCWVILAGTCVMMSIGFGMCLNSVGVFLPFVAQSLGVSKGAVSYYMTIQGLGMMAGMFLAGKLIGKVSIRLLLSVATCVMAGCFCLMSFGTRLWHWYAIGFPLGVSVAFIAPLPISVLISNWFEQKRGFASGIAFAFSGIMGSVLSPIATCVIEQFGWSWAYRLYAALALVFMLPTALCIIVLKPEEKGMLPYGVVSGHREGEPCFHYGISIAAAKRLPVFYVVVITAGALSIAGGFNQQFPSFAASEKLDAQTGSYLVTACMAMQLVANVPLGMLCDRIGICKSATIYSAIGGMGALAMAFLHHPVAYYIGCGMYGVGVCQTMVVTPQLALEIFGKQDYEKVNSAVMVSFALLGAASHTVYAGVAERFGSYRPSLCLAGILYFMCIVLVNVAYRLGTELVTENRRVQCQLTGQQASVR